MTRYCPECEGRMNFFRYPVLRRVDHHGRKLAVYKCIECGHEEQFTT